MRQGVVCSDQGSRARRPGLWYQADIDAAIGGTPRLGVITRYRISGAEALHRKAIGRNTPHALHPGVHGGGTGVGKSKVFFGIAGGIGVSRDNDQPTWLSLDIDQRFDQDVGRAGFELGAAGSEQ